MKQLFATIFFTLLLNFSFAQNFLNIVVKDSISSEALIGATVLEEGTSNGGATGVDGKVKITFTKTGNVSLRIQLLGYLTKTIVVSIPRNGTLEILLAQNNAELEEITVSSIRTNSHIEDIPTRIEVLGQEDLEEENGIKPGNIISLLGDIAGMQMQQVSPSTGNINVRIQGLNGRYTQILKDGLPLYGGLSGSFSLLQIPPLDLKQIEIIKGSVSTLYGGDAIGGIINLISKDPQPERDWSITLNQSTLGETNVNQYYSKRIKNIGIALFGAYTNQQQQDVDEDGLSDVPKVSNIVIHPKIVFYMNPKSTLTLNYTGTFEDRKGGDLNYFSDVIDTLYHVKNITKRVSSDIEWQYDFSENKNLKVVISNSKLVNKLDTKDYDFNANQQIYYSEISYRKSGIKSDWVGGLNINADNFKNETAILSGVKDYNYSTVGLFLQNTWRPVEKLTIEIGIREDKHSEFDYIFLPRLSLMYKFSKKITARLNGGYGYKVPVLYSYADIENDLDQLVSQNRLSLERSQGVNGDFNYTALLSNKISFTINQSFFYTNLSQPVIETNDSLAIEFDNASNPLRTKGLQTYVRLKIEDFEIYLGYVFTDVEPLYDKIHTVVPVTPRHNFNTTFFYELKNWRFGIESAYFANQVDENYLHVKNYLTFAAMIQYNLKKLTFVLNCEDVNDFRQNKFGKIYDGTIYDPQFHKLWAPIDGRVINLSVKWKI